MKNKPAIILGIDPGTVIMGYGLIRVENQKPILVEMGILQLAKTKDHYERLMKIQQKITSLISTHHPDSFAIEAPFFGKNVQSMLKLGRAQGVAIASAMQAGLTVNEYAPRKIKQSITGNGNAAKEQVWEMLKHILSIREKPAFLDASDALAAAVCHFLQSGNPIQKNQTPIKNWKDFVQNNPQKLTRNK
ncbi:MAG: crossover junction endodeoxyribonuclease RuvC [Chitinophagaceae bacterium]